MRASARASDSSIRTIASGSCFAIRRAATPELNREGAVSFPRRESAPAFLAGALTFWRNCFGAQAAETGSVNAEGYTLTR